MRIRNDIIKVYKDVHIWVGILSGLCLFIAFYAGALTMFEKPLERWASPPNHLAPALPLERAPELVAATIAAHPEAARDYEIRITPTPDTPARMLWHVRGERRGDVASFAAALDGEGRLQTRALEKAEVAQWIDVLHQQVGLPFPHEVAMPIMGIIALLYCVALVSGVIVLLPTLVKDLFALRLGHNLKRMWLDAHNALGILSLPFHIVMALTAVVFAFHDQFYDLQERAVYPTAIEWGGEPPPERPPGAQVMPPAELVRQARLQAPGFEVLAVSYQTRGGVTQARLEGVDPRHPIRGRISTLVGANPYTGELHTDDIPGRHARYETAIASFFSLHFGNFGGLPVRWAYFLLGLAGAMLFYTGNVLWLESRRRKERGQGIVVQRRSSRVMACLTVGVALGCVAGISATLAAAKWLPGRVEDPAAWHRLVYYAVFLAATGWAFLRGAGRASWELALFAALATLLIPFSSLLGRWHLGGAWFPSGALAWVDGIALLGAGALMLMAVHARRRARFGPRDSVWADADMAAALPARARPEHPASG